MPDRLGACQVGLTWASSGPQVDHLRDRHPAKPRQATSAMKAVEGSGTAAA